MDGVAASELTSLVPQALAGSHVHRGLVGPFLHFLLRQGIVAVSYCLSTAKQMVLSFSSSSLTKSPQVTGLRLAFKVFSPHAVEAAVRSLSGLLHGGVADAVVSHQALFS